MMADQVTTTGIDGMLRYIKEHGETETVALSRALNVSQDLVEKWMDVLESSGLVKRSVRMGTIFVAPTGTQESKAGGVPVQKQAEQHPQAEASKQQAPQVGKPQATAATGAVPTQEKPLSTAAPTAPKTISVQTRNARFRQRQQPSVQNEELRSMQERAKATGPEGDINARMGEFISMLQEAEAMTKKTSEDLNIMLSQKKGEFTSLLDGVRNEEKELKDIVNRHRKELEEQYATTRTYRKDVDSMARRVASERKTLMDEASVLKQEYGSAAAQAADLQKTVSGLRSQLSSFLSFGNKFNEIKASINGMKGSIVETSKMLSDLSQQLKALSVFGEEKFGAEAGVAEKLSNEAADAAKKLDEINTGLDEVTRKGQGVAK